MKISIWLLCVLPFILSNDTQKAGGVGVKAVLPTVHIIAIGLNNYGIGKCYPCENDATAILEKIKKEKAHAILKELSGSRGLVKTKKDTILNPEEEIKVNSHLLLGNDATLENIKDALKQVISRSSTQDYFYLIFTGWTENLDDKGEVLLTYNEKNITSSKLEDYEYLTVRELASYLNQIAAKNQIVISESGLGKEFAQSLQSNLFELNPEIAVNTERNRIILTTIGAAYDFNPCSDTNSPLTNFILKTDNIFQVFHNYHYYEYLLNKAEISCSPNDTKYYFMSREEDYKILFKSALNNRASSRGLAPVNTKPTTQDIEEAPSKTFALVIATNLYNTNQEDWGNLKNPINDANAIAGLLENKFKVSTLKLYNEPKQTIIKAIIELKNNLTENDKLLVFIAGHGYYSEDFSQGYIVTTDSYDLKNDLGLDSYLPLSTLNNLLDGFHCKPILTVLDICYGSSFEINNADLVVENYSNTLFDDGVDKFIKDTDKNYSRIMLASGEGEVPDFWNNSLDHSPFANKLIKSLEEEEQFISPGKLYSYVRGNTTKPILKKFGKHEVKGDFLLKVE